MTRQHEYVRSDVTFTSDDARCAGWLYRPDGVENPPIVVLAHGFAAFRDLRLDAYASRFARAGYAAMVFDYRASGVIRSLGVQSKMSHSATRAAKALLPFR